MFLPAWKTGIMAAAAAAYPPQSAESRKGEIMSDKKYVSYEQFGAAGDGVTDDFDAIEAAHLYANEHCIAVKGKSDATYYIGEKLTHEIPIAYDVDWNGASFIIDDTVSNTYRCRNVPLFGIRSQKRVLEGEELTAKIGLGRTIRRGDVKLDWLAPVLTEDAYIKVVNDNHRDFIRFGSNENQGVARHDTFEVAKDGTLDPETDVAYEFDDITRIEIYPAHETPITLKNGNFASVCCRTVKETEFLGRWHGHKRGIYVERADVTIENITHKMLNEPELDKTRDELARIYGNRGESYPYEGFIIGRNANRLTLKNCLLTSHTTYYEDKPATVSTGWKVPAPVPLGSYDMYFYSCNRVSLIGIRQNCPTGIEDTRYWGIMASNNCKNFLLRDCYMNRFDAHQGFWNATLINCTIGHSINITGGGKLYCEGVTKLVGDHFLAIRGDYGGSFEGDVTVKNCTLAGRRAYNSTREPVPNEMQPIPEAYLFAPGGSSNHELFYNWDFGYELYLPKTVTVDNFTHGATGNLYIYPELGDTRFVNNYKHHHHVTEKIIYKNMSTLPITTKGENSTVLQAIPVIVE